MKKNRKCIVWVSVIVVVAIVLGVNRENWFGDLMEPPYRLPPGISRVMLLPGEDGLTDRTLTWVSGTRDEYVVTLSADTVVRSVSATVEEVHTHGGDTYIYKVSLPGLAAGRYGYEIGDVSGRERYSDSIVVSPSSPMQEFVLIGDLQDHGVDEAAPFVRHVAERYPGMTAWLFIGDQVERPHDQYWEIFHETIRPVASSTPMIAIAGNHEYEWGLPFVLAPRWQATMAYPANGPGKRAATSYYIDYPSVRIVCLDTNILYAHAGSMSRWLRQVLTERDDNPFLIVMGHHGVYSVRKGRYNLLMRQMIRPILEEAGVDLVLSGHDHSYARNSEELSPGTERRLPVYVTTSSASKCYPVGDPSKHVVSLSGERFYQHIRVTSDSLFFDCYRPGDKVLDSFAIGK